jgi:hypothetical protein
MHLPDKTSDAACRCGHGRLAHEHYRAGTECALCPDCRRFRPATGMVSRLVAALRQRPRSRP